MTFYPEALQELVEEFQEAEDKRERLKCSLNSLTKSWSCQRPNGRMKPVFEVANPRPMYGSLKGRFILVPQTRIGRLDGRVEHRH